MQASSDFWTMFESRYEEHVSGGYRYLDEGKATGGRVVLLLHGMIGGPGNWDGTIPSVVSAGFRAVVPRLPVFELPKEESTIPGLVDWLVGFMDTVGLRRPVVAGNSLGGHVATLLAIRHPERVGALVLVGSSGIHEMDLGAAVLRRNDREFIRERAALTFYEPTHVTEQLLDSVMRTINDRAQALRLIRLARSAKKEVVTEHLPTIDVPTLVVWGRQDRVTPPEVAETLVRLIPDARLSWLDKCGHAPMMERPAGFNVALGGFLGDLNGRLA